MSGVHAQILERGAIVGEALLIGAKVPKIHHADAIPVYFVTQHAQGHLIQLHDGRLVRLLAYPSHWRGPGFQAPDRWIYAKHERLPWNAPIPCFDLPEVGHD